MYEVQTKARHNLYGESLNTIQREREKAVPMTTLMTAVFTAPSLVPRTGVTYRIRVRIY
jgi:hypothetical protein